MKYNAKYRKREIYNYGKASEYLISYLTSEYRLNES